MNFHFSTFCSICGCVILFDMSVVPHGAFAAGKVRKNEEKLNQNPQKVDCNLTQYSSKYMNSVWGLYNRYSVHNLKKIMDNKNCFVQREVGQAQPLEKGSLPVAGILPKPEFL